MDILRSFQETAWLHIKKHGGRQQLQSNSCRRRPGCRDAGIIPAASGDVKHRHFRRVKGGPAVGQATLAHSSNKGKKKKKHVYTGQPHLWFNAHSFITTKTAKKKKNPSMSNKLVLDRQNVVGPAMYYHCSNRKPNTLLTQRWLNSPQH